MRLLTEGEIEISKRLIEEVAIADNSHGIKSNHTKKFRRCNNAKRPKPRRKK